MQLVSSWHCVISKWHVISKHLPLAGTVSSMLAALVMLRCLGLKLVCAAVSSISTTLQGVCDSVKARCCSMLSTTGHSLCAMLCCARSVRGSVLHPVSCVLCCVLDVVSSSTGCVDDCVPQCVRSAGSTLCCVILG
jgi:hypothetical protein